MELVLPDARHRGIRTRQACQAFVRGRGVLHPPGQRSYRGAHDEDDGSLCCCAPNAVPVAADLAPRPSGSSMVDRRSSIPAR